MRYPREKCRLALQRLRIAPGLGDLGKRLVEPVEDALVEPGARAGFAMFAGPLGRLKGQRGLAAGEPVVEVARGRADLVVLGRADEGRTTNRLRPLRRIVSGQSQVFDRRLEPMHEQATPQRPALREVAN